WDVRESQICDVREWTWEVRRSITQSGASAHRGGYPRTDAEGGRNGAAPPRPERGIELSDTMHLHDLTPTERLVEEAAERGFLEEKELEAFADEHELAEDETAALRSALE